MSTIKLLQRIQGMLQISINQLKEPYFSKLNSNVLKEQLVILFEFQKYWFEQLEAIQNWNKHLPDNNEDYVNLP